MGIKLVVMGSELVGEAWRQTMMKALTPYIPSGVTLSLSDDDFSSDTLNYLADATVEMINAYNRLYHVRGEWMILGGDLYFDDGGP